VDGETRGRGRDVDCGRAGAPRGWLRVARRATETVTPAFSGPRMLEEHVLTALAAYRYLLFLARVTTLLNSRSHSTALATVAQRSQSRPLKPTVENACCSSGV
jgi:hypothetical protein